MRLRVVSDLHLDRDPSWTLAPCGEDALLCAGDIGSVAVRDKVEAMIAGYPLPFFYTPGNHDSYDGEVWEVLDFYRKMEARYPHFRCLCNETAELGPFLVAGTPLWTDFALHGKGMAGVAMLMAERHINDFSHTTFVRPRRPNADGMRPLARLRPLHMVAWHRIARRFLRDALAQGRPTIVLTHWCPSESTTHPRYLGDATNPYYVSNCEDLMGDNAVLWVHGHSHSFVDRVINGTRVVRNPKGNPTEYTGWDSSMVIDLPVAS